MTGEDWPKEFVGAWQNMPLDVRRFLTAKLIERQLILLDGPAGLIEWLYRGQPVDGGIIRYTEEAKAIWTQVLADARAWVQARDAKNTPSPQR